MDQPAFFQHRAPSVFVFEAYRAQEEAALHVEFLTILQDVHLRQAEPFFPGTAETEADPVGKIDKIFVFYHPSLYFRLEAVVSPGQIGSGVVDSIGLRLGGSSPCGKVTVSQSAKGFPQFFMLWVEVLINQRPHRHRDSPLCAEMIIFRNRST